MWPRGRESLGQAASSDVGFTEAISQRMQVPERLKVADEEDPSRSGPPERKPLGEAWTPAFQMHVPDRLLLADMTDSPFRPLLERHLASDPPWAAAAFGEPPFRSLACRSGPQKRKRLGHLGQVRKEQTWAEDPPLTVGCQRRSWQDPRCSPPSPTRPWLPLPSEGRIYSLRNSLRVLHFLGLWLLWLLRGAGREPPLSPQEGPLEELSAAEMLAMRRQLSNISGRLRHLEEQCVGWRQKELLVYSALLSVCLLDLWLWLRR